MKISFLPLVLVAWTCPSCVGQEFCQPSCAQGSGTLESAADCANLISGGLNQCDPGGIGANIGTCSDYGPCDNGGRVCACSATTCVDTTCGEGASAVSSNPQCTNQLPGLPGQCDPSGLGLSNTGTCIGTALCDAGLVCGCWATNFSICT